MRTGARLRLRRYARRPFPSTGGVTLVHCSHHRAGTTWLQGVLFQLAGEYGLRVSREFGRPRSRSTHLLFFEHGRDFSRRRLDDRAFRGSHMIRDPRDVIVSSYFYHLWTTETWAHAPRPDLGGRTYQQQLRALSTDEGLMMEVERTAHWEIRDMLAWDYAQPEFLEMRYEDTIADETGGFQRLFRWYGLSDHAVQRGLSIASDHSFRAKTGRRIGEAADGSHLRSGRPGEWRDVLNSDHLARLEAIVGDAPQLLGYEPA